MFHHLFGRLLWVMDEHIQAANRVEGAAQAFQVAGEEVELGHVEAGLARPALRFLGHGLGDVACINRPSPHGRQRQAQAADAAAGVAEARLVQFSALLDPSQHFIDGFLVTDTDVALHLVHVITVAIDAIPAIKSRGFEITFDDLFFILFYFKLLFRCHCV